MLGNSSCKVSNPAWLQARAPRLTASLQQNQTEWLASTGLGIISEERQAQGGELSLWFQFSCPRHNLWPLAHTKLSGTAKMILALLSL